MPESLAVELVLTRLTTSAVPMEIQPAEDQGNAAEPGESHHHTSSSASSGPALDSRQGENQGGNEVGESGSTPPGAPCISAGDSSKSLVLPLQYSAGLPQGNFTYICAFYIYVCIALSHVCRLCCMAPFYNQLATCEYGMTWRIPGGAHGTLWCVIMHGSTMPNIKYACSCAA